MGGSEVGWVADGAGWCAWWEAGHSLDVVYGHCGGLCGLSADGTGWQGLSVPLQGLPVVLVVVSWVGDGSILAHLGPCGACFWVLGGPGRVWKGLGGRFWGFWGLFLAPGRSFRDPKWPLGASEGYQLGRRRPQVTKARMKAALEAIAAQHGITLEELVAWALDEEG